MTVGGFVLTVVGAATLVFVAITGERVVSRSAQKDRITVVYWEKWTGAEAAEMQKVVTAFNNSQDRIFVKYLSISSVDQKTLLATSGGNPPDVAGIWQEQVFQFADAKALTELTPMANASGLTRDYYISSYYDALSREGKLWALPSTPASIALYVRSDLMPSDADTPEEFPKTIEAMDKLGERVTKRDGSKIARAGFLPSNPGWWNYAWGPLFGGKLIENDRPLLDTPESERAFNWIASYGKRFGPQAVQSFQSGFGTFSSPQDPFMSGKVAMEMNGSWKASYINVYKPDTKWFAVPIPYPEDRPDLKDHTMLSQDVLVIPRGAKHAKEAWEFIRFVQRQDVMEGLCVGHGKNSPLNEVSEGFYRRHPNKAIRLFDRLARSKNAIYPVRTGAWPQAGNELNIAFQEVNTGAKPPKEALKDAQARADGLWKTYRVQVAGQ
ncbi:extracellular solute-binding protein [bacterium]|nr:MAG: extracellular solute-binding protein [bacterium]